MAMCGTIALLSLALTASVRAIAVEDTPDSLCWMQSWMRDTVGQARAPVVPHTISLLAALDAEMMALDAEKTAESIDSLDLQFETISETAVKREVEELTVMLKAAKHQDRFGNYLWTTPKKPMCNSTQKIVYQPTMPRSGNTWTLFCLEEASGIATYSVFKGDICSLVNRCLCGTTKDCGHVRPPANDEPSLFKLHYPFLGSKTEFDPPVQHAVFTIRNPFDNFLAWLRYKINKQHRNESAESAATESEFRSYLSQYVRHFAHWFRQAKNDCMQITMVRFEDLVEHQSQILQNMQDAVGWTSFSTERAQATYAPDEKLIAEHLYHNPARWSQTPVLQRAAQNLTRPEKDLMELLGYGKFIVKL